MAKKTKYKGWPITKRPTKNGDRFDIEVYLYTDRETGKRVFYRKSFRSYGEAEAKVIELKGRKKGGGARPMASNTTLAEWLTDWLDLHSTQVRARTLHGYRGIVERWITFPPAYPNGSARPKPPSGVPRVGHIKLRDLGVHDFDRLYLYMFQHGLRGQGIKPKTIRGAHIVFRRALKDAVTKGFLAANPTDGATIPKAEARAKKGSAEKKKVRAMGQAQAERFLAAAREDRHSALWHVLLLGGLRPSEAFALEWEDVNWEAGAVKVAGSLNRVGLDEVEHPEGWQLTAPKTDSSNRIVPLPPMAMKELEAWRTQQKRDRLLAGPEWAGGGFVFTTSVGTPLDLSNIRRGSFRAVMEAAGIGTHGAEPEKPRSGPTARRPFKPAFRLYDLRHTCASLLLKAGVPLKVVQAILGHKSISITADIYGHLIDDMVQEPAEKLEAMLGAG